MNKERVSKEEIFSALRTSGVTHVQNVEAVVLETDGSLSVLKKSEKGPADTLKHVKGIDI